MCVRIAGLRKQCGMRSRWRIGDAVHLRAAERHNIPTAGGASQCGTSVAFQYPYGFNLPFQSFTLQLKATAQMRVENQ